MSISVTSANRALDLLLGDDHDAVYPDPVYVALYNGNTELTFTGYARVPLDNDTATWPDAASGVKTCDVLVQFAEFTAGATTTFNRVAIMSASTAGFEIIGGWIDSAPSGTTVAVGSEPKFEVGELSFTLASAA